MIAVDFRDIHRAYKRGVDVLDGITVSFEEGQVVGLVGKNGAGKTTLIRIAMGMIEPQGGVVRIFGLDPRDKPLDVKRRVGYVSEDQILPPFLTIGEVIDLHRGLFDSWDDQMECDLRERFELSRGTKIKNLSKGQARQVALLCAVAHRPELLLLDEPAGGLDPAARREFLETSIQYLNEEGSTILFSSLTSCSFRLAMAWERSAGAWRIRGRTSPIVWIRTRTITSMSRFGSMRSPGTAGSPKIWLRGVSLTRRGALPSVKDAEQASTRLTIPP